MIRFCTECGAEVGTLHHRGLSFIWKKKPKKLIIKQREQAILLGGGGG